MPRIPLVRNVFAYRTHLRVLLFAGITVLTAWSTFTSYSAKLDEASEQANPGQGDSRVPPKRPEGSGQANINKNYGNLPLSFEANRGQADASVNFVARGPGYNIFLTPGEAVLTFQNTGKEPKEVSVTPEDPDDGSALGPTSRQDRIERLRERVMKQDSGKKPSVLKMRFDGANTSAGAAEGVEELPGKVNYLLGSDSSKWLANIPTYSKVAYRNVYPGVDVIYYGSGRQLEYDLVVAPGADPSVVTVKYEGARDLSVGRDGNLVLKTEAGDIHQQKPLVYQEENGARKLIEGRYVIRGKNKVGFRVSSYNRSRPLVIDPILSYSSFVNSSGDGYSIAVDPSGFAYITGSVVIDAQLGNFDLPSTSGAYQTVSGGGSDVFVTKINKEGSGAIYSTFLGGNGTDAGYGIAVDSAGSAYVTGAASGTFPTTTGAPQTARGSATDAFVAKLSPTGSGLVYSTFLGGNEYDDGDGIAVDASGNAYVVGQTFSTNLATTPGVVRPNSGGGTDNFVAKLNSTGTGLAYLTYLGGGGFDFGLGIALDASGNVYATGQTSSLNFPQVNGLQAPGGLDRGFFRSTDAGNNYTLRRTGMNDSFVYSIAVDPITPATIYAGTGGGVYKSTDGGGSWTQVAVATGPRGTIRALLINPSAPATVYAGGGSGVFKSTDGGNTWAPANNGLVITASGGVTSAPNVVALASPVSAPSAVYAASTSGMFKTTDGGANWSSISTGLVGNVVNSVAIDPVNPQIVYAGTSLGVSRSTNGGASWTTINVGLNTINSRDVNTLAINPTNGATIYAATQAGVYKTTNSGSSWGVVNNGLLQPQSDGTFRSNPAMRSLVIDPSAPNTIYAGVRGAFFLNGLVGLTTVFKTTDGGANWTAVRNGFGNFSTVWSLALDPSNPTTVYAGTLGDTDSYLAKVNGNGTALTYSTYLGGSRTDYGRGVAVDATGSAYVSGFTQGPGFPLTTGAVQTVSKGGGDIFLTKFDPSGASRVYSTLLGGSSLEDGYGVALDSGGNAYVAGSTYSTDFPVTPGSFQTKIGGNGQVLTRDAFVAKINPSGSVLLYSSYLGGSGSEPDGTILPLNTIAVDAQGNAYLLGVTSDENTFPAFDFANGFNAGIGSSATYVAKVEATTPSFSITGRLTTASNTPIAGVFIETSNGQGFFRGGVSDSQGYYAIISLPAGDYTVTPNKYDSQGRHYLFTPPTRTFTGLNSDQTANFTGTQVYDIQGLITSSTIPNLGIFDVTVTLSGPASPSASTVTDANGFFAFRDLLPGNYTVTPTKTGFTFNPVNRTFTNLSADQFATFTTASASFFTVSGRISTAGNVGISNATVSMLLKPMIGQIGRTVQTDANGNYSFANLQGGGNYSFVPVKPLLTFAPQSQTFSNLNGNQTLNFIAAPATGLIGKIAFEKSSGEGAAISVMNADGTGETDIVNTGSQYCGDGAPAWSPDGSRIAFSKCDGFAENASEEAGADLYLMNADGSGLRLLTGQPHGEFFPSWSPDATRLTYTFGECSGTDTLIPEIFGIDATGANRTPLTNNALIDGFSDWSPNGSRIVFARGFTSNCSSTEVGGDPDLYEMDTKGGNERRLTSTSDDDFWPAYSPDASKIAFTRINDFNDFTNFAESIYVMNADGTGEIKITPDSIFAQKPTWSPDGTKIAFDGYLFGQFASQIFVVNADGTGLTQITSGTAYRRWPSWQHYSISGRVIGNTSGLPVTMALAGTLTRISQTDANGNYVFGNLSPGGNYSVTPVSTAFVFTPAKTEFTNLVGNQIANFNVVPQAIPTATPPLVDNFAGALRDPAKWNLGTQTQPMGAFDPQVTVVQTNGQLVIAPRGTVSGPHYNGYVSVNSFDMTGGSASLEMVQPATGGAETIFAIGSDLDNFFRFVVNTGTPAGSRKEVKGADGMKLQPDSPQLLLQVKIAGQLTTLPFPYDPVQHHFMRFRHEPPTDSILFETSPIVIDYTIRLRQPLEKGLSALAVELSAGTSTPTTPGQAVLDNFSLVTSTFQFASAGYNVGEGDGSVLITVTRASSTATDAGSVDYATADGTALKGTKYIQTTGTLTFAAGQTSKTFSVPIVDNPLAEGNQTLDLVLSNSTGSGLNSPGRAVLTIIDNETVLTAGQAEIKTWTFQGTTYAYVKLLFPNSGYRVASFGQAVRSGNDFTGDAVVEKLTGASVQSVTTTAGIYDLGALSPGSYNFTFKNSGTVVKTLAFTVAAPPFPANSIDTAREFVKQQYRDFLNREADQAGEDFWTDNITKCSDPARRPLIGETRQTEAECTVRQRETTSGAFFLSPEFQYTGYYVYRMYQGALGRQPKLSEFTPDAQFVGAGILVNSQLSGAKINQNKADFAQQFVNCTDAAKSRCAEFKAIYDGLNNQQYVDRLFQTTGVNASAADRAALVNGLNANPATETRASVLQKVVDGIVVIAEGNQQFTTSYGQAFYNAEFNRAFVQLQYFGYMKRDPDDAGYAFWLGKLNQFGGNFVNAEMVLAFISSPEYRARFGQP